MMMTRGERRMTMTMGDERASDDDTEILADSADK